MDGDTLTRRLSNLGGESKLLRGRCVQLDTLAHQRKFKLIATFDDAGHFAVPDVGVSFAWVESHLQVKVRVRVDVSALGSNREVLLVKL